LEDTEPFIELCISNLCCAGCILILGLFAVKRTTSLLHSV